MDGNEQVRLDTARLLHTDAQRHEIVVIAGEHRPHPRLVVEQSLQLPGNGERDVLFVGTAAADRSGVFAAMAWIDHNDDAPPRRRLAHGAIVCRWRVRYRRLRACRFARALIALDFEQRHQRVERRKRIKVEHDAVSVLGDRFQREELRIDFRLEIEHDAQHARAIHRDANRPDVRIAG